LEPDWWRLDSRLHPVSTPRRPSNGAPQDTAATNRVALCNAQQTTPVNLRVTTIFRPENGTWKVVHRHADPITQARPASSVIADDQPS